MDDLDKQVAIAVVTSIALAVRAGLNRGPAGTPAFFDAAFEVLREREARVWTLSADPDEWLRQMEAAAYRDFLSDPDRAKQMLLEALEWGRRGQ